MHAGQVPSQLSYAPAPALVFLLYCFLQEPLDNDYPLPIILITYANNDQGPNSKSSLAREEKGHCKPFLMFSTAHAQGRKSHFPGEGEDGWAVATMTPTFLLGRHTVCGRCCGIGLAVNPSFTPDLRQGSPPLRTEFLTCEV